MIIWWTVNSDDFSLTNIIYSVEHSMSVDEACDLLDEFGEKILD